MARKPQPSRRRSAAAISRKTHKVTLSPAIARALASDLSVARDTLLDIQTGEGDDERNWLTVLSTLRTLEVVLLSALVDAAQTEVSK